MYNNYLATEDDISTIGEGIETVGRSELDFIFSNRNPDFHKIVQKSVFIAGLDCK